ncbi:uncharacterized protein LOC114135025 isoform X1 [Xiphophorus couchianus]|uniref:uncharacterized protein LOC114135025 isoform X1 n=2 Tax=Xiphophorus couchianus TaxID=32473 RepID=UPI00101615B6|nr:uncharacterized protein LOC114135025 isoform X1 [Xiphophorus couchianus]
MNRRKLATSRRNKGKQRVNDPETQPDVEPREGVQDEARGNEHPETHASATKQPKVQEEVAQESERDMTAPQAAFLVSATTAEYSEDKTGMLCPEEVKHILSSKDVSTQPVKDKTKLEVIESSNTLQSEEVNENLHDRLPELTSLRASASNQQMISKQAEDFNLCSVAELNSSKLDDSGLFRQDGRLHGNFSVCESRVNTSITPQITADNAFRENINFNDAVEQETFLFQTEELPTSTYDQHCTPKVRDAKLSHEVEDDQYDQNKLTQEQVEYDKHISTEDLLYFHKDYSSFFENQKSESDSYQSLFLVKSTAVKQDVLTATKETSLDQMLQSGSHVEDSMQTLPSVFKAITETQLHNSSLTTDNHTKGVFSSGATKRKFGSSRKNKGRHVKDSEEDILENTLNNESLETPTVSSEIQETGNEEVSDVTTADTILSLSNRGSVCLVPPHDLSSEYPKPDTYSLILTSESHKKGQDKINSEILAEMFENSDVSQYEVDQSDILHSEEPIDSLSEDVPTNLQKVEFHPTQMQENLQIQHSSETILDYVTEHFENISENLNDRPEMSESAGKSTDDVAIKQQEHQTEENILEYTHSVEQKNKSYDLYDANSLQISNLEKSNSTPTQIYEFKKGVEDDTEDIKLTADQMYHQEKGLFEVGEENPVLFDSQPQETSGIVDEQPTKGFYSSANRGKLGSGSKSRGQQDKHSKEEVKEKTSNEETTQILDTKIMSQEELRRDILPVSYDSPILSIFAPGHSLEDPGSLIPGSVSIPESQENSETDINMDLFDKSWGETLGCQSDSHKSKSGSLQTKEVPDPDVDMRKGQEHVALQEPEPQQIDYTVADQVEKVGVFVEDTKHDPSDPLLQDDSLSTNEQTDTGFSGSRSKLGSSQREKGRQQGEIPKQEVLENTKDDEIHERQTMLMQEELTEDSELRTITSVSNNSSLPSSPLDQSFKELSCVPTKYSETDLEDISVNSENFQKNQNESKLDTENTVDVSQRAMDEFEDNLDAVAGDKEIMDGEHSDNTVKQDQGNEDPLKDLEEKMELDYISEIVAHDTPKYPETVLGGLVDQAKVTSNIHSELTVKSTEDSATKHKLMLIEDQQNTCFIAEGDVEALDQTSKDGRLYDSKETSISSPLGITANLGQTDKGGSLVEGSEHNPTDTNLQDTSLTTDEQIDAGFSFKGNKRKLGSSHRKKGRQDVKESKQDVLENNGGEKAIDTSPVLLKVETSEQEELSKASEEEIFWSHSISTSHVLSSEDHTSEVTEGPGTHLKGLIMKCENHQEDVEKINLNVLVQDGKQSEDLSLSQYKAHTEDIRDAGLEEFMVEHPEEVHSITIQDNLQMGYYSETSTNINKTFDIMSENLTEQNERSQSTVKDNDDITEKQEECPTEEMISETLDLKSGEIEQDDTKPKVDQIFHEEKEGMFCEMEENKPVLSNVQIETVSLDPKPQEPSESTKEQINTDFSSRASRRKLGSSRKGKARRQVDEFTDEVNEETRVDEVDETHRTTQISLDTKTISHEEKRQDMEQDVTLLVSNDNSFSVFACGDSSEVQGPIQKNQAEVELNSLIQEIVNCPENQNQSEFLQSKDKTLRNKEVMSPEHSENAVIQAHEHDNTPTDIERSLQMDSSSETVTHGVHTHSSISAPGLSSEFQSSMGNNHPETDLKSLIKKNKPGDHDGIDLSDNSEEDSLLDKSDFLQCKDRALQNKVIGGELSDNAVKRAQENEDLPTNTEGNLEIDYTPETVARDVPKYPETALEGVIDQAEISSKIHSELTLKHTADSCTEQELIPAEDQPNLCSTTERNLESLNQTSKDDHLYVSKETSISGPIGGNTTLGDMDEGGTLEEGSEHNSNVQDSSVSTNEQTNDGFSFNGSRRKLGSSRRNKGRPGFKESRQEVFENHRSDETPQTPTISVETRGSELEELSEDIEHKIILSLSQDLSSVSPHILSSENQISVLKNDSDTNLQILILKNEHFGDKGERKLETEVEMIEKSMNVPHQEVGQSDNAHSEDTKDAEPEDALREVEKIEFHTTQMQDSIQTECYSETVVGNVSENEEVIPENLTDQTGMSELTVKATDVSATKEETYCVKKIYPENLDVKKEDNNKPQVTDLEKTNSVPTEMNEFEGRISDDTKPNTGFVVDLEMGGLCEMKENSSAWLNAQTDMVSFDSQTHELSQNVDEQLNKGIYNTSNRRKLGSSRRIKGRHQVKESKEEGKENTSGDETLNISETKMACEELKQDLLSPDSSVLAPGNSSDVQSSMLNNYSETDLKSLIQESHSEDQDESETGNVKLSHKSEEDTLLDKSDVQESHDQTLQSKVTGPGCSDNAEEQAEEHENLPADIEVCLQMDYTSETVAHDIPTYPESDLGNTIDQAEIINHSQSDLTTKSYAYSNTKEELLPAEGQQNLCFTTQGNLEALDQTSKDERIFDSKETSISNPVGVNSTLSQMGKGGILVESITQNPKETRHQDNSLTTDEQTDAGSHWSRRKLGSSRRKKGRQQGKESQEEVLENTSGDKTFEMPIMSLETKTVEQEEQREETKHEIILSVSHDSSMSLIPPVISSHDQTTSVPTNYPDEDVQRLTLKNENLHEDADDTKSDVLTSDEAKQNVFHGDPRNAVSENVVHEEVHSTQIQDSVQTDSDKIFADDAAENVDIISRALTDKTEESEINMNSIDDITSLQKACPSKGIISAAPGLKNEETIQQDVQPNTDHIVNQNNEGLFLQMTGKKIAMSNLQSENVSSGSNPLDSSERVEEQTKVDVHSRRKLRSSRRNKGRGNAKDIGQPITEVDLNASRNELGEKTTETVAQDQEPLMGIVLDETEENDSSQTKDANISTSFCMTVGMQLSPIVDQEDSDTSCCTQVTDKEVPKHHSRDHDEYRELQDGNLQESTSLPEPHAGPPPAELHAEKNSSCEHTEPESGDGDAFMKAFEQETEPEQNQKMLEATEKERDDITEYPQAFSRNLFSENEKNAMNEITEILQPDKNVQSEQLSEPPERTTEKGSSMQNAQVVYSIEQGAVSSPQEMFCTDGEEHRHIILSMAAETHYLLDIQSKEQKEPNKTGQMQEMHQISFPNDKSLREIMQSDKDVTLDSHPQDNYQDLKDDAHPGLKASGNRRKLGSSRRTKGRKHGQVNEPNQENKDKALENTGDDETTKILAGRQEELENFILPKTLATFSSPVTEKLLEENTVSSHVLEDSTIAKSDFNSNSNQENAIKSNVETKEKDAKLIDETEDSTQLTGHDTNKTGLMQSGQDSVLSSDSDMHSILFHDGVISPKSESVYVIHQEEALQRQKREALSREKDPLGAEVHLKETNKKIETAGFIKEVCSSQVESSMDLQNPEKGEVEGKYMYARKQKNTSNEFVSASQEPAMDASYEGGISTTINPLKSQGEKPQETSKQKKRKIGSSRRIPLNRKRDGERHERDEEEESDFSAKAEMTNLSEMEVVGKVLVNEEVLQGKDVQPQQEASLQQETPETETGDGLQSSNTSLAFPPEQSASIDLILETPKPDDFTNSQAQICSEDTERKRSSLNQPVSSNTGTPGGSLECTQGDERSPESIEVSQVQDVQEQMPSSMIESIHSQNPGMRNGSPDLTPTNRRRKMGSTRKNLGTRTKQEILEPEKESTDTVLSSGDVTVASVSGKKETELQLHTEHTDDNIYQEKQNETVEISQFGESLLRALAEEEKTEESSISQTQTAETRRQWNPSELSSSPSNDGTSESAFGGRRKKFGSNRKSGLQQRKPDQNAQNEDEAGGLIEGSALKAAEGEESSGLRKISEVDENGQTPSSSTDILEATGSSKSMRDKTPEKLVHRNIRLDQESGSQLSFGTTSGADKSDGYNVVMIGESCVGKTSFMKRAQSGKFSLDIPASVGLDSCKWTVVVDGKPVVLHLWDTAGQERFHSITRQVYHKAQAFLLMYDITSSQSFSAVSYWANSIQEAAAEDVTVLLLGNKSEHAKRQVKTEQGDILAKEYNFEFMECSAATGENVIEALEAVARMLSQRADLLSEEVTVLHKEPAQRKSSKCC